MAVRLSTLTALLTATLALTVLAPAASARACSCALEARDPAFAAAVSVFEGRVTAYEEAGEMTALVTVNVVRTWKGADRETMVLRTQGNGAMCGYAVEVGGSHLFYTYRPEGTDEEWVGLCSRSSLVTSDQAAGDIRAMGAGVTPVDPEGGTEEPPPTPGAIPALEDRAAGTTGGSPSASEAAGEQNQQDPGDDETATATPRAANGGAGGCASCNVDGGPVGPPSMIISLLVVALAGWRRRRRNT